MEHAALNPELPNCRLAVIFHTQLVLSNFPDPTKKMRALTVSAQKLHVTRPQDPAGAVTVADRLHLSLRVRTPLMVGAAARRFADRYVADLLALAEAGS